MLFSYRICGRAAGLFLRTAAPPHSLPCRSRIPLPDQVENMRIIIGFDGIQPTRPAGREGRSKGLAPLADDETAVDIQGRTVGFGQRFKLFSRGNKFGRNQGNDVLLEMVRWSDCHYLTVWLTGQTRRLQHPEARFDTAGFQTWNLSEKIPK